MGQSHSAVLLGACATGDVDKVQKMVELRHVSVEIRNTERKGAKGETPLYLAAAHGHIEVVQYLLDQGANANAVLKGVDASTALLAATSNGHEDVVRTLLTKGAEPNVTTASKGATPLHKAAASALATACKALLEFGADPNIKDNSGSSPLYYAALKGSLGIVEMLLEHKAKVNSHARHGRTALHCAVKQGHQDVCQALLDHGARVDSVDGHGRTTVHEDILHAAKYPEIADMLDDAHNQSSRDVASDESSVPSHDGKEEDGEAADEEDGDGQNEDCKICMEEKIDCVLVPCGHLCVCFGCAELISDCPICRASIQSKVKTFHA